MLDAKRQQRLVEQTARDTRAVLDKAKDAARRDEFMASVLTGTATRQIIGVFLASMVGAFMGAGILLALFGGRL
jgi:hypothetical protein